MTFHLLRLMKSVSLERKKRPVSPSECNDPNTDYRVLFALSSETGCLCHINVSAFSNYIIALLTLSTISQIGHFSQKLRKKTRILPASASKIRVLGHRFELVCNSAYSTPLNRGQNGWILWLRQVSPLHFDITLEYFGCPRFAVPGFRHDVAIEFRFVRNQ